MGKSKRRYLCRGIWPRSSRTTRSSVFPNPGSGGPRGFLGFAGGFLILYNFFWVGEREKICGIKSPGFFGAGQYPWDLRRNRVWRTAGFCRTLLLDFRFLKFGSSTFAPLTSPPSRPEPKRGVSIGLGCSGSGFPDSGSG